MFKLTQRILAIISVSALTLLGTAFAGFRQTPDKIGIYDLKTIRSVPLDPEILAKTKQGDVNIEQVRFTSLPGVRIYAILTYKDNAHGLAGYVKVERFGAQPLIEQGKNGFLGMSVMAPTGNTDPKRMESLGGPKLIPGTFSIADAYTDDPKDSYIYQYTVALLRAMDYLATRPEVNLSITTVAGYSWAGTMVALLHALDDREAAYIVFHGLGAYVDENGMSGGEPSVISRQKYEMYCPTAYAQYGTKPFFLGTALDDYYTKLDAVVETYRKLNCPKEFVYVPNRHHSETSRQEMLSHIPWLQYWQFGSEKPPTISEGTVTNAGGKLIYSCSIESKYNLAHAEALVAFGRPGDWMGKTWHRFNMVKVGDTYQAEIPVYDPSLPFYVIGQINTAEKHDAGNGPQYIVPSALGITAANATYPDLLFDPSQKDDLYIRTGDIEWSGDGPDSKGSVIVGPGEEGTITFQNIDGDLWQGKTALTIWLKGDGKPGPITAYLAYKSQYYVEIGHNNYTEIQLVPKGTAFPVGWHQYVIHLEKVKHLKEVSTLFLDPNKRRLQIGAIRLK